MANQQRIRPPATGNDPPIPDFKAQTEAELPAIALAPDIENQRRDPEPGLGAIYVSQSPGAPSGPAAASKAAPVYASPLSPEQAAAERAQHNAPNALGKPFVPTLNEKLMAAYAQARNDWKAKYAKHRNGAKEAREAAEAEEHYFAVKQECIQAGLIDADTGNLKL